MRRSACLSAVLFGFFMGAIAFADCVDGVRQTTPRETEYFQRVFAALKETLPPAPPNWTVSPVRDQTLTSLCSGIKEGDFYIRIEARYTYRPPKEEADRLYAEARKIQTEIDALEKMPPDAAKERQEWMNKYSEATRAARQADKDGNKELAKQKYAERDGYDKKASEVRTRYLASIKPQVDPLRAKIAALSYAPQDVLMRITANEKSPTSPDPKRGSEIIVGKIPAPQAPILKVHGIWVLLEGPEGKRRELESAIDKEKLKRILQ
jgi:hypothetical protein